MTTTVPVLFSWDDFKPDQRVYRQQSISLTPHVGDHTLMIKIDVPLEHTYIANAEEIIQAKIANGSKAPEPILTLAGVRWIVDQWDEVFYKTEAEKEEIKATEDDDWGETKTTTDDEWGDTPATVSQPAQAADDEWAEESKSDDKDAAWDETKEDWGS
jgi:hypothetical protein